MLVKIFLANNVGKKIKKQIKLLNIFLKNKSVGSLLL